MAKLPQIKKLAVEDYPEQKQWIEKLLLPINQFMEGVSSAFSKGLTLGDNLNAQIASVAITGGTVPVYFKCTTPTRPISVMVGDVKDKNGGASGVTGPVSVLWEYVPQSNQVKINQIFGLTTGTKYTLTLEVKAG